MAKREDWLPRARADQLAMCRNWLSVMTAETRTAWGIPQAQFVELGTLFAAAQELLQKAQSSDRTPVIIEQCREAFDARSDYGVRIYYGLSGAHRSLPVPLNQS